MQAQTLRSRLASAEKPPDVVAAMPVNLFLEGRIKSADSPRASRGQRAVLARAIDELSSKARAVHACSVVQVNDVEHSRGSKPQHRCRKVKRVG